MTPPPHRLPLLVVALGGLLLGAALAACPSNDAATGKATIGTDGRERWVVTFTGEPPDLAEYRALARDNPKAVEPYVTQMRDSVMRGRTELEGFLSSVEGRVVERWWMSNAVTVEVPAGAVGTLKTLPGVKQVAPDPTLE